MRCLYRYLTLGASCFMFIFITAFVSEMMQPLKSLGFIKDDQLNVLRDIAKREMRLSSVPSRLSAAENDSVFLVDKEITRKFQGITGKEGFKAIIPPPGSMYNSTNPLLVHLLSYQRTGSSFTGSMFYSNPDVFYIYEPVDMVYSAMYGLDPGWTVPSDIFYNDGLLRKIHPDEINAITWVMERIYACQISSLPVQMLMHQFWAQFSGEGFMPTSTSYVACLESKGLKMEGNTSSYKYCWKKLYDGDIRGGNICPKRFIHTARSLDRCKYVLWNHGKWNSTEEEILQFFPRGPEKRFQRYFDCFKSFAEDVRTCASIHLDTVCETKPIRVIKSVRATMEVGLRLMERHPNFKLLHLIRDPRAVAWSRAASAWTHGLWEHGTVRELSAAYCIRATEDLKLRLEHEKIYPDRMRRVVYEELLNMTEKGVADIHSFLGIELSNKTERHLYNKLDQRDNSFTPNEAWLLKMKKSQSTLKGENDKANRWKYFYTRSDKRVIRQSCAPFFDITRDVSWLSDAGVPTNRSEEPLYVHLLSYPNCGATYIGSLLASNPRSFYIAEPVEMVYTVMYGLKPGGAHPSDIFYYKGRMRTTPRYELAAITWVLERIYTCELSLLPVQFLIHDSWQQFARNDTMPVAGNFVQCMHSFNASLADGALYEQCRQNLGDLCDERFDPSSKKNSKCRRVLWSNNIWKSTAQHIRSAFDASSTEKILSYFACFDRYEKAARHCAKTQLDAPCLKSRIRVIKTLRVPFEVSYEMLNLFPNMKTLHLLRNPAAVTWSRSQRTRTSGLWESGSIEDIAAGYCSRAADDHERRVKYFAAGNAGRTMRLTFEQFVGPSAFTHTEQMFQFLDVGMARETTFLLQGKARYIGALTKYEIDLALLLNVTSALATNFDRYDYFFTTVQKNNIKRVCSFFYQFMPYL